MGSMKTRDTRLDLIRTVAVALVVSVHFFLNSGYYDLPMEGPGMLVMTALRMAFMICVPLFLLLTGYLCRNKVLSGRYYLGIVRILLTYGLCALVCLELRQAGGEALGWKGVLRGLLDFSGAPYGWYVKMYIGLFLLIPFLNVLWKGLAGRGQRKALIATLALMTVLPTLTNARFPLLPDWWMSALYPLTYYFLGAYFGEYEPRVSWRWGIPALLAAALAGAGLAFWLSRGGAFVWRPVLDTYGPTVALSACLVFLMLLRVPADRAPGWLKWLLRKCSELSLGAYLLSWCFDKAFYPILTARVDTMNARMAWFVVIVPAVLLASTLASQVIEWVRKGITWAINKLCPKANLR